MQAAPYAFTIDEWREEAGFPEAEEGGELRWGSLALVPFNSSGSGAEAPSSTPSEEPSAAPAPDSSPPDGVGENAARATKADAETDARMAERINRVLRSVDQGVIAEGLAAHWSDLVEEFGQAALDEVGAGIDFELADPHVQDFLRRRAADRVRYINGTTRESLRETLSEGVAAGEGIEPLAKRVEATFADAIGRRARVIARTETTRAAAVGSNEGIRQAGVEEKQWLAVRDDRTRDSHVALDGQHVPVDADFVSPETGASGPGPGDLGDPAEDVNCRCTTVGYFEGEASFLASEAKADAVWKGRERSRSRYERIFVSALATAFSEQRAAALQALRNR
jgi:SPP1 gp7 family putative phage head morphogenesis protein